MGLHVKILEKSQFWYQASPSDKVADVVHQIVIIYNDRIKLSHLLVALKEEKNEQQKLEEILLKLEMEAESFLGQNLFETGSCLTSQDSSELLQKAKKTLEIVFSVPLPLHLINVLDTQSPDMLKDESSALWFAGKEMKPEKPLSEYVGKNEKTKVIVKLQKKSSGPPPREGRMSEEQEKQMLLDSFKRHQELQRERESEGEGERG